MKTIFAFDKKISKNKALSTQLSFCISYVWSIIMNIELFTHNNYFKFHFDFFSFIGLNIEWSRRCDHAGFTFMFTFPIGFFHFEIYDGRHWNWMTEDYEIYD